MVGKIFTWAATIVASLSLLVGYLLSHATWKNDVLFLFGVGCWGLWIVILGVKKCLELLTMWMRYKDEKKRKAYEQRIRDMYADPDRLFN